MQMKTRRVSKPWLSAVTTSAILPLPWLLNEWSSDRTVQRQTAVTAYFSSKQLLLFTFAIRHCRTSIAWVSWCCRLVLHTISHSLAFSPRDHGQTLVLSAHHALSPSPPQPFTPTTLTYSSINRRD